MSFEYSAAKFSSARLALMLPHPEGEDRCIAIAFDECSYGLDRFDRTLFDESAHKWAAELDRLRNTDGLQDPQKEGRNLVKARTLSVEDQILLSTVIDELQIWFGNRVANGRRTDT